MTLDADGDRARDEIITSAANPAIKLARSLHRRRMRHRERALLVEGIRSIRTAVEHGARLRVLLIDASRAADATAPEVETVRAAAQRVLLIDTTLFRSIAETDTPQPLMAICDFPTTRIPEDCTLVLTLDGVRDPGNLGTLIRSAAAAGVDAVALLPGTVDPTHARAVRASAGAIFSVPLGWFSNVDEIGQRCFTAPPAVVVARAVAPTDYDAYNWRRPAVLVVGSESHGEREETRTFADSFVTIPMTADVESLNAGVAGSIILFEAARQRRAQR